MPHGQRGISRARKLHYTHASEILASPIGRKARLDLDLVWYHDYREGTHPVEDREYVRVSPLAVVPPKRTRKVLAGDQGRMALRNIAGQPRNRQEAFLEKIHRVDAIGGSALRSTEIKARGGRDYSGAKNDGAQDKLGQAMRDQVSVSWDAHHATMVSGNATREGRAAYRPERTSNRSTVKLGDMKAV